MTRDDQPKLDPRTAIGHVHLKVAELERAVAFCRDVLGFDVTARLGEQAAFLSAGGYHHIGLNTWESRGGASPPRESTGLYHFAIRYPTRVALGRAMRRLREHGHPIDGTAHHAVSEAVYLRDPDGHGIELYWDRPEAEWPRGTGGDVLLTVDPLDIEGLLAATGAAGGEDADDAAG